MDVHAYSYNVYQSTDVTSTGLRGDINLCSILNLTYPTSYEYATPTQLPATVGYNWVTSTLTTHLTQLAIK